MLSESQDTNQETAPKMAGFIIIKNISLLDKQINKSNY